MRKFSLISILLFLLPVHTLLSQDLFSLRKPVSKKPVHVSYVQAVDMDKDGDMDVLSAGSIDDKFFWFENQGNGNFGEGQLIDVLIDDPVNAVPADLNGDGWLDIVSFSYFHDKIVWLENYGDNSYSGRKTISNTDGYVERVGAVDIDGDGDIDVLAANGNGVVVWYKNDGNGGFGSFWNNAIDLPNNIMNPNTFFASDLDKDGDIDVVCASQYEDKIAWNENDGEGNFGQQKLIATNTESNLIVRAVDMDKDGDIDIVSGSRNVISWYENTGDETFSNPKVVSEMVDEVHDLSFGDLDEDGDIDIVSASYDDDKIAWYENDGEENFGQQNLISIWNEWTSSVEVVDLDGDGSLDILVNTSGDGKVVWYENQANHEYINCFAFIDENENGSYDSNEEPLPNQVFHLNPAYVASTTSNAFGNAYFYTKYGDYELAYIPNPLWEITSDSPSYSISLDKDTELPTYFFGFKPKENQYKIVASLNNSYFQCYSKIKYWLSAFNAGSTEVNGTLTLMIDSLTTEILEIVPEPSVTEDYKFVWNYSNLAPNQNFTVEVNTRSPDNQNSGETLIMKGNADIIGNNSQIIDSDSVKLLTELCLTFNSNSKNYTTNRKVESGKAYIGDTLLYTIQFYNTHDELATNVRIEDSLDRHLDWESFHTVSASHNFKTTLDYETGFLIFHFDDINLPANSFDKDEGSGYITYGIKSLDSVEENTEVTNKSYNFFDFNIPTITNTVVAILIEEVETDIQTLVANEGEVRVVPNPFSDYTIIEVEGLLQGNYRLQLMDILGRKVRELKSIENGKFRIERGKLESGMYLFRVLSTDNKMIGSGKVLVE